MSDTVERIIATHTPSIQRHNREVLYWPLHLTVMGLPLAPCPGEVGTKFDLVAHFIIAGLGFSAHDILQPLLENLFVFFFCVDLACNVEVCPACSLTRPLVFLSLVSTLNCLVC